MIGPRGLNFELFPQNGKTVVLLNGMTQSTLHWRSQARAMQDTFQILTYDARGQGGTSVGDEPLSLELHAEDLAVLLDSLGIDDVYLVGFSHGARVALKFATEFPHRTRAMVLCSATARPTALARTIIRSWGEVLKAGGLEAMSWSSLPTILGEKFLRENEHLLGGIIKASLQRNSVDGVSKLLEGMRDYPDLSDLARHVSCQTLVISADEDLLVTRQGAEELAHLTRGRHVEVKGCGHTIPIEAPDEFREAVLGFLRGVDG